MASPRLLSQVQLLEGPGLPPRRTDVLLEHGRLAAEGEAARARAAALGLRPLEASGWWLAPPLVDPHSVLEDPHTGRAETLDSLARSAVAAGYGWVALLPQARRWRDAPEALQLAATADSGLALRLWGSLSVGGDGQELAPQAEQLAAGAVGLAEGPQLPPLALLERSLALGEMEGAPVLLAPRDRALSQQGLVREGVEALRAGWPMDPPLSETLPLQGLLALAAQHPQRQLRLMNLSTAAAVDLLAALPAAGRPAASVSWWHLLADSGSLDPIAEGWRVEPPLGTPADRAALIDALAGGVLSAVAVHHAPLDPEEQLLPLDQRKPGVAGHRFVLPALWQELVLGRGWSPERLWEALCWGPARFLALEEPRLATGGTAWILFDPQQPWQASSDPEAPLAANQPLGDRQLRGQVLATGLRASLWRGPT
ncbi:dihydroorotase [Vulcanococcus limneticus]|uniref:dihydroorotase n=1 Tax=Vulcanococcus limneticus TaxID=2170428 RepID=UPI00398BE15A